jgi:phosphoribosylformylglycinamidine synthase
MKWRVEIQYKKGIFDPLGESVEKVITDLGISAVSRVDVIYVYNLEGKLTQAQVKRICRELLADPITQTYSFHSGKAVPDKTSPANVQAVEIAYNPGVMDPVEQSTIKGIRDLGITQIDAVSTAKKYLLYGNPSPQTLDRIVDKALCNPLIQHRVVEPVFTKDKILLSLEIEEPHSTVMSVGLLKASDRKLKQISREGQLFLNLKEMQTIQRYYRKLKRDPTDCELETIAQTWSEHCFHKTFRGNIDYTFVDGKKEKTTRIRNLLKSTIAKATHELNKPWCVSVFHDNAGVIRFDQDDNICFKVETHNHPSALEPFGGANTGIGGVIRDILGTGLGAKPICCTDVFCFAPPDMPFDALPEGTLHPKRIMKGVVSGVRDYGNKMGIPTVNGAIVFDPKFVGNPLVYCGNVGILPRDKVSKKVHAGDLIVVVGGKTGRDGIHGATFSSGELTEESSVISSGAVQIGDPIQEKKVLDALLQARDRDLYSAITDCGAGGLSSAVGEMGKELGARVELAKVPLKYQGLSYTEIWISESQERMVLSVPPKHKKALLKVFADENVEATVIGEFTRTKRLELFYQGQTVCDLAMEFLHDGDPKITKKAVWKPRRHKKPKLGSARDLNGSLLSVLGHFNVCSKEWVIRQYDHEVQGGSIIKPLAGHRCDGPSDASVVVPKLGSSKGVAVSNGINVRFGMIDPYWMAGSCIDEALRQIVAVGGDVSKIAILDNFCWGNPDKPDRLGSLVRAAQGCYRFAKGFQVPFISGKDSLYNEYMQNNRSTAIPGTLLISAVGIIQDVNRCVTMDLKEAGNRLYCVGTTYPEMGGSIYYESLNALGNAVPHVDLAANRRTYDALTQLTRKGWARSLHDCSEGGLAVALAEMAFSSGLGVTARVDRVPYQGEPRNDFVLFSESNGRFVLEVRPEDQSKVERLLTRREVDFAFIGTVEPTPEFVIYGFQEKPCINLFTKDMKTAWQAPLNRIFH